MDSEAWLGDQMTASRLIMTDDGRVPMVSVVMPVRDAADFLAKSVSSILGQSFGDLELIVIDDGSLDATPELVRDYRAVDSRVRLIVRPHAGVSAALNHGCRLARGRLIARMDADDIALPDRLERQVAFLRTHDDIAVLGSAYTAIDRSGMPVGHRHLPVLHDDIARRLLAGANAIAHPTVVMRRSAFLASGGYARRFEGAEDYELWLRMLGRFRFANLSEPLLLYRIHPGATSEAKRLKQVLAGRAALAAYRRPPPSPTIGSPAIRWSHIKRLDLDKCDRVCLAVAVAVAAIRQMRHADPHTDADLDDAAVALLGIVSGQGPQAIAEIALEHVIASRRRDVEVASAMAALARTLAHVGRFRQAVWWLARAGEAHPGGAVGLVFLAARFLEQRIRNVVATQENRQSIG